LCISDDVKRFTIFSYEPELFPGLIYRMVKPRIVLLIFVSGKVVLTGMWNCGNLNSDLAEKTRSIMVY